MRLRKILLNPRRLVEVLADFVLISVAFGVAYLLFTTGDGTTNQKHIFLVSLPVILAVRYLAFIAFGLYSGVWRFAGAREAAAITGAVVISEPIAVGDHLAQLRPVRRLPGQHLRGRRSSSASR